MGRAEADDRSALRLLRRASTAGSSSDEDAHSPCLAQIRHGSAIAARFNGCVQGEEVVVESDLAVSVGQRRMGVRP